LASIIPSQLEALDFMLPSEQKKRPLLKDQNDALMGHLKHRYTEPKAGAEIEDIQFCFHDTAWKKLGQNKEVEISTDNLGASR
jgi:hypothetical protein